MGNKITPLKKLYFLLSSGLIFISAVDGFAKQVPASQAKQVAENFFSRYSAVKASAGLSYTSFDAQQQPLFYVFNINTNSGFVIVSADDAAAPIIGYSTEQGFQQPDNRSAIAFWLSKREDEIKLLRKNNISADASVSSKWERYLNNMAGRAAAVTSNTVAPLVSTKWNQSPYYNALCPGGSVTGCVATTMAQIMKYWSYPEQGTGSSSYCNCFSSGFSNNYGTLSANYGATTYNWANMPLQVTSTNTDVATLMSHCGISVHMNYDPAGSGAQVISLGSPFSAQNSFINYFKYDPATISGVERFSYSDANWLSMLKHDIDIGRPVEYAGFGTTGGHTWVCDGYDDNDYFHMNWGWGGASDGFFYIDNLNPSGGDFTDMQLALFGIVPIGTSDDDAGISAISPYDNSCTNVQYSPVIKVRNFCNNPLSSFVVNYIVDNGPVQSIPWTGSLVHGQAADITIPGLTLSNGAHNITCVVADPNNGTDSNPLNDESSYSFSVYGQGTLPVVEGFETPAQTVNDWQALPSAGGSDWEITPQAFSGGARSAMINNISNTAGNISILQGMNDYDFSLILHPTFYFKVAYQQKSTANKDKLSLEISNDCGKTWWVKWTKQGAALATTSAMSAVPFVPAPAGFVQYTIPGLLNKHSIFRWVFVADPAAPGNNVYLDDINLGEVVTVGINESSPNAGKDLEVYPNPTNGETMLDLKLSSAATIEINVTDIAGRKVIEMPATEYNAGSQLVTLNKDGVLANGIYVITVSANGIKSSRKLVVN